MIEVTLHSTPRWRDVVLQQVAIVGRSLRPAALVVAVVLAIGTVMVGEEILRGGPGFDATETFPTALIAFLFPFAVWRNERPFGPAFLWTLPVDRRRLALAKTFAGGVWFMVALASFVSWLLVLGLLARASPAHTVRRIPYIATAAMYLFGSALVLGLRHPLRWLLGGAGVFMLMGGFSDALSRPGNREWRYVPGAGDFFSAVQHASTVWETLPAPAQWAISILLGCGAGLIALWLAASRHREHRRT